MSFYGVAKALCKVYYKILFRTEVEGLNNIPSGEDGFIVCANHKSMNDPVLLAANLPIRFSYIAKEELFRFKPFAALIKSLGAIPIKRGTGDLGALKVALKVLKDNGKLVIFPEGTRSRHEYMNKGKGGAALIAIKAKVKIVPIGIKGKYKPFSKIKINIGSPIELDEYYDKKVDSEALQKITDEIIMPTVSELSGVPTYENRNCG